ncbi:hypothetical protein Leryth_022026, partial [Lithospermum erythrorhizon]
MSYAHSLQYFHKNSIFNKTNITKLRKNVIICTHYNKQIIFLKFQTFIYEL